MPPDPLVPSEVDLRDFAFMPLDVRRLRDSKFAASASGEAFRVGVLLWCSAWHELPAGSLPDDDIELAQRAGFGRVIKEWQKVKKQALHGWVSCSDGRLYHAVVAEKAIEAWEQKLRHMYGKMQERTRKLNKQRGDHGMPPVNVPPYELWKSGGRKDPLPPESTPISAGKSPSVGQPTGQSPPETAVDNNGIPAENPLKGQGPEQTGTDRDRTGKYFNPAVATPTGEPSGPPAPATAGDKSPNVNGKPKGNGATEKPWWKDRAEAARVGASHQVFRRPNETDDDFLDRVFHAMKHPPAHHRSTA